jgi:transposase
MKPRSSTGAKWHGRGSKKGRRRKAIIVFVDASGFLLQPVNRRTWAPRGKTPIQYAWDRHDRLSVIAALLYRPRSGRLSLSFAIHDHNIKAPDFLEFVRQLRRQTRRPILLVCDRLNVHRSAVRQLQEQGAAWLTVEWLPPYAADFNPVEAVWQHTKYADLANYVPADSYELCDRVAESLNDQHFRPPLLQSFFRRAKLK